MSVRGNECTEKICFVVMGFGKKTDYESGRTLDLDASYEAIILPAAKNNELRCVRANEILHSGVIDARMFEMLLRADLVIADISTGNVNAVYELGVRHALRPHSTIIMKEKDGRMYFDLDHINTFEYAHLGEDIGQREAQRATNALSILIGQSLKNEVPDSPVYTFLPKLRQPHLTDEEFQTLLDRTDELGEKFAAIISEAECAAKQSKHTEAAEGFREALNYVPRDSYLIQQYALHTYKSQEPSPLMALVNAAKIIDPLQPERSNDPETLGIAGAIYKNMWLATEDGEMLTKAIQFYKRGYDLRGDYYTGENAATLMEVRSRTQQNKNEALFDSMLAQKVRESIVSSLSSVVEREDFDERSDKKWVFATLANCFLALGQVEQTDEFEKKFLEQEPAEWEVAAYRTGRQTVEDFLSSS